MPGLLYLSVSESIWAFKQLNGCFQYDFVCIVCVNLSTDFEHIYTISTATTNNTGRIKKKVLALSLACFV